MSSDHDQLQLAADLMAWASEILNGLLERHRKDYPLQMLAFLNGAKRDADLGKQEAEMGDRYMGWGYPIPQAEEKTA